MVKRIIVVLALVALALFFFDSTKSETVLDLSCFNDACCLEKYSEFDVCAFQGSTNECICLNQDGRLIANPS